MNQECGMQDARVRVRSGVWSRKKEREKLCVEDRRNLLELEMFVLEAKARAYRDIALNKNRSGGIQKVGAQSKIARNRGKIVALMWGAGTHCAANYYALL